MRCQPRFVSVDVFCAGLNSFALPVLRYLVTHNGGDIFLHKDFGMTQPPSHFALDAR